MTYEDFFIFFYPALFISGGLLSMIPAYIALKKNKNFWIWWICITAVFWVLLFVLIQIQAISMLIYSLLVLVIASILALRPKSDRVKIDFQLLRVLNKGSKLYPANGWLFLSALFAMLAISAILYYYLLSVKSNLTPTPELARYYITTRIVFFIASLGYASFMFVVSEKRIRYVLVNIALVALLSMPFFQKPSRTYGTLNVTGIIIRTDILLGVLITDLIRNPIVGIFVLLGICSGCVAILVVLNDKYKIMSRLVPAGVTIILAILYAVESYVPIIRFSKPTFLLSYALAGVLLFWMLGSWLGIVGIFVVGLIGTVFSSMVIIQSIKQQKILAVIIIFMFGLFSVLSMHQNDEATTMLIIGFFMFPFITPVLIIVVYGIGAGFASLILWVISDILNRSNDNNNLSQ